MSDKIIVTEEHIPDMRDCGTCALCCKLPQIVNSVGGLTDKPAAKWCKFWSVKGGCGVYETRDPVCRDFNCFWKAKFLPEQFFPPKVHCVVMVNPQDTLVVLVDPAYPNAYNEGIMLKFLQHWGKEFVVEIGQKRMLMSSA